MDAGVWTERIRQFSQERDWEQYHSPKNLAMALSVEASEIVEIFQWLTPEQAAAVMDGPEGEHVREEVADVLTYLLRLADVLDIDLDAALTDKAAKNAARYPAPSAAEGGPVDPATLRPVVVTTPVLGAAQASDGWVGTLLAPGGARPSVLVASTLEALVEIARERHPDLARVALDGSGDEVSPFVAAHPTIEVVIGGAEPIPGDSVAERLAALRARGLAAPSVLRGSGYGAVEVLEAVALAIATA